MFVSHWHWNSLIDHIKLLFIRIQIGANFVKLGWFYYAELESFVLHQLPIKYCTIAYYEGL